MKRNLLGKTGLSVTSLCVGTSALGSFPSQYGYEVTEEQAIATIRRVLEGPINFIDTSNEYGNGGASECRIGRALAEAGGLPHDFVLATKVDPLPCSDDFSGDRVQASVGESLERLGLDRLQLVYLHDPEKISFEFGMGRGGPVEALVRLRDQGAIGYLGVAGGPIDLMLKYIETGVFDVALSHNRYTLVDQSAVVLIEAAARRGMGFVNAAPFGGGILVKGPEGQPKYSYAPASSAILDRIGRVDRLCKEHGVPLAALALQFSLRNPDIASTVVGMSEPERISTSIRLAEWPIPDMLWTKLNAL